MSASLLSQPFFEKACTMTGSGDAPDLTVMFARMRNGDEDVVGSVVAVLYKELRRLAARQLRREAKQHTLQPTALVNEAYLRLMHGPDVINDRQHFFALAAQAMRRVLVDHARQKRSQKRGGGAERVTLELVPGVEAYDVDMLALDEALSTLQTHDPRAVRVVELRFFGGHTDKEVCEILGENLSTVRRDWEFARSWLKARLEPQATK